MTEIRTGKGNLKEESASFLFSALPGKKQE